MVNGTWQVNVRPFRQRSGFSGAIDHVETFPKRCYIQYAELEFSRPALQFPTDINVTFNIPFFINPKATLKVTMPGFTNNFINMPRNPVKLVSTAVTGNGNPSFIGNGRSTRLFGVTWSTTFAWTAYWVEGDYRDNYADSHLLLVSNGYQTEHKETWISIPKERNNLIAVCGKPFNSDLFQFSINSTYYLTPPFPVTVSNPIGPGCSCNSHGKCNLCTMKCECDDGYGSDNDRWFSITDDFKGDCTARACKTGPAIAAVLDFRTEVYRRNHTDRSMHRLMECSNNGLCDRTSGQCKCNPGFGGAACEKMLCPGRTPPKGGGDANSAASWGQSCSGRGRCMSIGRLPSNYEALPLTHRRYPYNDVNDTDKSWDAHLGAQCVCDSSWPVGLDPGETQLAEYFGPACQWQRCPSGDDPATSWDETDCEGKSQTGGEKGLKGNKCHVNCSNKGSCNFKTGVCTCDPGFTGHNCGIPVR